MIRSDNAAAHTDDTVKHYTRQVFIRSSCQADTVFWNKPLYNCYQDVGGNQDNNFGVYNCDWLDCNFYSCYTMPWDPTSPCSEAVQDPCWVGSYNTMLAESAGILAQTTQNLLDQNGFQTVLANLSALATTGLPEEAYNFYQRVGYPQYLCVFNTSQDPTVHAAVARGRKSKMAL